MAAVTPEPAPAPLARVVVAVVEWVTRHPRIVLLGCLAVAIVSLHAAITRLEYHTQRNDLLNANKPCQQRWQRYLDTFGDDDDMVVVAEGSNPERMKAALDAVAERVKQQPEHFDRVFHRVDLRSLHDRAILYLSLEELEAIRGRVDRMEPLMGPLASLAWQRLSLESLLSTAAAGLEARSSGQEIGPGERDLLAQLPAVTRSATAALREPATYQNPWAVAGPASAGRAEEKQLTEPHYFFTLDGSLALLTCRPRKAAQSFTPAKEANEAMRGILAEVGPNFPGVTLGLTGLPVLETDEMVLSDQDSGRASWLAMLGVAVLYFVVYRGFRYPLLTLASLLCGTVWALGWATATIGHLNILSSTFAVMLIGMGDYGVLWVAQYDEARKKGEPVAAALRSTAAHAGPSIVTAAATTALAFFATMLADFQAVAELGWIAGWGVLLCAASCLTIVPALLTLVDRTRLMPAAAALPLAPLQATNSTQMAFLPGLSRRPRLVLGLGAALLVVCGAFAGRLSYDHNLLNLQPRGLDSVTWEHKLIDKTAGATWDAMSIASSREEALALKARYEAVPEVGNVVEAASLIPADQDRKIAVVAAIRSRLATLQPPEKLPLPPGSSVVAIRQFTIRIAAHPGCDKALSLALAELRGTLDGLPTEIATNRLREFDRRLAADLAADLNHLKAVARPAPITLADLPPELRERSIGNGGEFLVRAFARDSLWDYAALQRFTTAASNVDPQATGKSFRTLEGLRQMKSGFEWAGLYSLIAIVIVLAFDLRRMRDLLLVLLPLAIGVVLTLGVMGLCGVALNPANMIALPLIVGVGVENGVHVLHDYRSRDRGLPYRLGRATGRGVFVAALTTILGFGTLMIARHRGMASLGLALTLGVTFCMIAALVWLPAVLRILDRRGWVAPADRVPPANWRIDRPGASPRLRGPHPRTPADATSPSSPPGDSQTAARPDREHRSA